jgi:multicomponent Na+:H+ antiporter subunit D
MFGALAFALLILSGYYPPEIRSVNLDVDWFYRVFFGRFLYPVLDKSLNGLNAVAEKGVLGVVGAGGRVLQGFITSVLLFFSVNAWMLMGYRGKRLEMKKHKLYTDVQAGTLPVGLGAAISTLFIVLVYMIT